MFICNICNKKFNNLIGLGTHIGMMHKEIIRGEYYKLYINKNSTGLCKLCKEPTRFISLGDGYNEYCKKCSFLRTKEFFITKYGKNGIKEYIKYKDKSRKSNSLNWYIEKYGIEKGNKKWNDRKKSCAVSEKIMIKKYGKMEGLKRWNLIIKKKKFSNSKEGLIKNHGKEKAEKICKSLGFNKENFIEKYGIEKWNITSFNRGKSVRREYYLEDAQTNYDLADWLLKQRQTTFSKDICIEKYGEKEGIKVWQKRQNKWQNNLKSKPQEEINRINRAKTTNMKYYSISSYEREIKEILNCKSQIEIDDYKFDLGINDKIIEFNGDYWHCNPKLYEEKYYNGKKIKRK